MKESQAMMPTISPYLFDIFIETSVNELKSKTAGIKINGQRVYGIRFADDIVLLAKSQNFQLKKAVKDRHTWLWRCL